MPDLTDYECDCPVPHNRPICSNCGRRVGDTDSTPTCACGVRMGQPHPRSEACDGWLENDRNNDVDRVTTTNLTTDFHCNRCEAPDGGCDRRVHRAYDDGLADERAWTVTELERMLGVCTYPEVSAFIPLLIERLKAGAHRA